MSRAEFLASLGMTEDDVVATAEEAPPVKAASGSSWERISASTRDNGWDMMNSSAKMEENAMKATSSSSSSSESADVWAARYASQVKPSSPVAASYSESKFSDVPVPPPRRGSIDFNNTRESIKTPPEYGRRSPSLDPVRPSQEMNSASSSSAAFTYGRRSSVEPPPGYTHEFNNTTTLPTSSSYERHSDTVLPAESDLQYGGGGSAGFSYGNNSIPQQPSSNISKKKGRRSTEEPLTAQLAAEIEAAGDDTPVSTLKELGNKAFQQKAFSPAIRLYSLAIEKNPMDSILFSNRSAAFLQSAMLSGAVLSLRDADKCIELQPKWFKGFSRAGDAHFKQLKYSKALEMYNQSLALDPGNENTRRSVKQCMDELESENTKKQYKSQMLERECDEHHEVRKRCADVAAAGRCYKEAELMKYRNKSDSRPSSRTDEDSSYTTGYSSPLSVSADDGCTFKGSQKAQAYRDQLLASFRSKGVKPPPKSTDFSNYSGADFTTKQTFPKDTTKATDYVGKVISADSYDVHTYNQKHF